MDNPITYAISTSHLSACGSSARASHFNIAQNTTAVQREDIAYTSDSTAENQNVSVKAYASAPTTPEAITTNSCGELNSAWSDVPTNTLRAKAVIVQNRKRIVKPLQTTDPIFIQNAIRDVSPIAKLENRFCIIKNRGAPGWCTICILKAEAINSPQSHQLTVRSTVMIYITVAMIPHIHPKRLLIFL